MLDIINGDESMMESDGNIGERIRRVREVVRRKLKELEASGGG